MKEGDRVATLAFNTYRHLEIQFNPRLFEDQIRYIIDHADDALLLVDLRSG